MSGACDGLRVVDFSFWMAGPLATMVLADNGADVIKVEPPGGDPARQLPAFQTWNRGKKSVVLDLKTPEGRDRAQALASDADAVFVAMRPGTPQKLGIDYERLRAVNPRLVYASITGYGEDGPWSRLKGYDALVTARSGRMMMFERVADRPGPAFPSLPCASYTAAMLSLQGVMAALHRRAETGHGQKVSVSLLASLIPYDLIMWIGWQLRGDEIDAAGQPANMVLQNLLGERRVAQKPGSYDPKQLYRPQVRVPRPNYLTAVTKDGVWLQFANTMDHLCVAQMTALGLLDLYGQERFAKLPAVFTEEDAEELWQTVLERVRSKTYAEWLQVFEKEGNIAVERIRSPLESLQHRQILHNGQAVEVPGLSGNLTLQPGPLARFDKTPAAIRSGAPALGQHTTEVLDGLLARLQRLDPDAQAIEKAKEAKNGPLTGVTIIDFSSWIAAPYATAILANLGARVIRVEPVGGDVSRYSTGGLLSFPMTQGKESIALDLKHPDGLKIVQSLIIRADGVVHNFRPGVPERLGIDYKTCRKINPRLVYLNAASYGENGPDAHRPMFFATAAALGGNQLRQAGRGHPAPNAQVSDMEHLKQEAWRLLKAAEGNADPIAAVAAAAAFLMALYARECTGTGQQVLTTMVGSDLYANSDEAIAYAGRPRGPEVDQGLYGYGPFYRLYETASGWIFLSCTRRDEWTAFCRAAGRPDMEAEWEHTAGNEDSLAAKVAAILGERTAERWESLMLEHNVPLVAVEMRDPGRFNIQDPEMRRQGHAVQAESPAHGSYWRHGALQHFSEDGAAFGAWEPLGGHTREILRELGFAPAEISRLSTERVVEIWSPEPEQVQA